MAKNTIGAGKGAPQESGSEQAALQITVGVCQKSSNYTLGIHVHLVKWW